jgi:methylamine dehydrogenase light chain
MSPVTWLGTCRNPADGRDYVISYNDCCGKDACGRCICMRHQGDRPVYMPSRSNDIDWCMGQIGIVYNSTVAIVAGVATEPS